MTSGKYSQNFGGLYSINSKKKKKKKKQQLVIRVRKEMFFCFLFFLKENSNNQWFNVIHPASHTIGRLAVKKLNCHFLPNKMRIQEYCGIITERIMTGCTKYRHVDRSFSSVCVLLILCNCKEGSRFTEPRLFISAVEDTGSGSRMPSSTHMQKPRLWEKHSVWLMIS